MSTGIDQMAISHSRGNPLTALVLAILGASTSDLTSMPPLALLRQTEWLRFCSVVHRLRLAPLCYERLRNIAPIVPSDVLEWLRAQYYANVARNLILLDELERITNRFTRAGIAALALKGPVIAHVGCGLRTRVFNDLDLLVRKEALGGAETIMADLGYAEVPGDVHPFHVSYFYSGSGKGLPVGVEMHFDVVDRGKPFLPDLAGIWKRSQIVSIDGLAVSAPALLDHLLLMVIQLPTHWWSLRLLLDLAFSISRNAIGWDEVLERARTWRIRVLTGSALHVIASLLSGQLPEGAKSFAEPEGYLQRVQWRIVRAAVLEFLEGGTVLSRLAPLVVADDFQDTRRLIDKKRTVFATSAAPLPNDFVRTLALGLHAVPTLLRILLGSWVRGSSDPMGTEVFRR